MKFFVFLFLSISLFGYSEAIKVKKIYPMGEKIYKKKCQNITPSNFTNIQILKQNLKCKHISQKHLDMVAIYLWDKKRASQKNVHIKEIIVTKTEKCPICGMFVYKYPKWASQIFYGKEHYSFDGVKDMMKYYFKHQKNITDMLVRDYYSQESIKADEAFYVIGSNVYGPMGSELIPFVDEEDAKTFYIDHNGKKIIKFKNITKKLVYKLDE